MSVYKHIGTKLGVRPISTPSSFTILQGMGHVGMSRPKCRLV
jgi:hypothetical protein